MKRKPLFITASVLLIGGLIGSLLNVLPVYGIVGETDAVTADARLDRAEMIGNLCVMAVVVGTLLFLVWTVLLLRYTRQAHAHKASK